MLGARGHAPRPPPASAAADAPGCLWTTPRTPWTLSLPLGPFSPLLVLFLANARTPPSPPLAVAVATVHLSPRRSAQKLRPVPLLLLAKLPDVRSPWSVVVDLVFNLRP